MEQFKIKSLIAGLFCALFIIFSGCRVKQPTVIQKEEIVWIHKDSIVTKDSTVYIPVEVYRDYSNMLDTLVLSTSMAESKSWLDTNNKMLAGEIKNLKSVEYKYIEVDRIVTNDSIVEREIPVPYPVVEEKKVIPTFAIICICWTVISFVTLLGLVYLKFIRP